MSATKQSTSSAFEQLRGTVSDAADNLGATAREFAQETLQNTQQYASSCYEQGRAQARAVEQSLERMIRNRPLKAIMIVAGIALLIGGLSLRAKG